MVFRTVWVRIYCQTDNPRRRTGSRRNRGRGRRVRYFSRRPGRGYYYLTMISIKLNRIFYSARLDDTVEQVREVIGSESTSGISDAFLKDVAWNNYFDVGRSIEEVMGELFCANIYRQRQVCLTRP